MFTAYLSQDSIYLFGIYRYFRRAIDSLSKCAQFGLILSGNNIDVFYRRHGAAAIRIIELNQYDCEAISVHQL